MSGRDKFPVSSGAMGRLMNKIKRSVSEADEKRDPLQRGYSRVEAADGSLSNSSTSTSLDTVVIESAKDSTLLSGGIKTGADQQQNIRVPFSPILETEDADSVSALNNLSITSNSSTLKTFENPIISNLKKSSASSKPSLKGSKVSFEQPDNDSDDSFEERRGHFQQKKSLSSSATDRKGILKDLKNSRLDADRRAFQSKKHVSLDIKNSRILERILNGSSSEEEFTSNRKHFQSRKHQSLDARVKLNLNKVTKSDSSDEEFDEKGNLLQERIYDFSKPIVIDFKDLEPSDDDEDEEEDKIEEDKEDFEAARSNFQKQKTISVESRKSIRFFEMDDMTGRKGENIRTAVPFVRQITQDGKPKLEVYRTTTNPIYYYTQILAALSVSLGSLVVGFSSGYTSPALVSMRTDAPFNVTADEESWIGGLMPLAGLAGGIAGGPLIEILGRKSTILATSVPFIISWLLIAFAVGVWMIFAGRALSGFCVGIASLSLPVYLGETVQPEVRGTLGLLPTAFGNIGILMSFVFGSFLDWSELAFLGSTLPVPFLLLMLIIPETPRWYVSKGKDERARKALQWLRGKQADVEPELKGIVKTHTDSERHSSSNGIMQLLRRSNLKPLSISLGLMFFQQFSGINAVIFYAENIFASAGSQIKPTICSIILGVVNFIAIFIATVLIDRLGRKMLLYISSVGMTVSLASLGAYFYLKDYAESDVSQIGWLPLGSLAVYILSFSLGFGPIPWLMMGEILPAKIRGTAASVATGFNWSCTFIVAKSFNDLKAAFQMFGCFWIFATICLIGLFFVIFKVPETQGKSLEDIERKMMGRIRRMSSVANIRPLSFNL